MTAAFVLVHGSWHGAWCWYRLVPRLRAAGHEVRRPELPAHGVDPASAGAVTFGDYVDRVAGAVDAADGPVTLVGHSMGGHVVTQVAEERPDAVGTVVYLAAFLPPDGRALTDLDPSGYGSVVPEYATRDAGRGVVTMDPAGAETAFYHDCGAGDVALGRSLLRPEPVAPRTVPVSLTTAGYGSVRRAYVECADDRALPVAFQRSMREAVPCDEVRTLGTGHSPFFAAPDDLRAVLEAVAVGAEG